jgi:hypothetical protein
VHFAGRASGGAPSYSDPWTYALEGTKHATTLDANDACLYQGGYTRAFAVTDPAGHPASAQVKITVTSTVPGYSGRAPGPRTQLGSVLAADSLATTLAFAAVLLGVAITAATL